jgi:hypothetical protein
VKYAHSLRVTRQGDGGTQDPKSGEWLPPTEAVLYDGPADYQDESVAVEFDEDGTPTRRADGTAYVPDYKRKDVRLMQPGDHAVVRFPLGEGGGVEDAAVAETQVMDGAVFLNRVR